MKLKQYLTEANEKYAVLGVNDDQDFCELCGKTNLKRVVWFSKLGAEGEETGKPFATGTDCAARLIMYGNAKATKKAPKRLTDSIWQVAQGLDYVRKWMRKYKDEKGLNAILNGVSRYGFNGEIVYTGDKIHGLVVANKSEVGGLWSITLNGKEKRWDYKTPLRSAKNWVISMSMKGR